VVIGNPYDDQVFRDLGQTTRTRALVFVGRLVSDKGADLLLEALSILAQSSDTPAVTIVGDGPERPALEQRTRTFGLQSSVTFVGNQKGLELASTLNNHRVQVVPSRWSEPFGIVALEGIACGCVVVGSANGGLPEAIGPCGITFPNGDAPALAQALKELLRDPTRVEDLRRRAPDHLARFSRRSVAARYLQIMEAEPA
jgi:glycosyltransferase involved in cell wall biosynthesis